MKSLHQYSINPNLIAAEYAVRGKLVLEANKIEKEINESKLQHKPNPYPFDKVIYCNIGNPQLFNQKPLTYVRQVLSLVEYPELMRISNLYPDDIKQHAEYIMKSLKCIGTTGAYTNSQGVLEFRNSIAHFIKRRDRYECSSDSIYITDGASSAIKMILHLFISHNLHGIMIPIPQYPLYSAVITQFGGTQVPYYLNEEDNWSIDINSLFSTWSKATSKGIIIKAFVVINPGNPTGQVLSIENMKTIIEFCYEKKICLLVDEVYQDNIWGSIPFTSFRKVLLSMDEPIKSSVELFSFFSVSKGFYGECGKRGGYLQIENIDDFVHKQLIKMTSINLCSNVVGQEVVELICNPPQEGDCSYPIYYREKTEILSSLKRKASILHSVLNSCNGIECNEAMGSLYLFPKIILPKQFIEECEKYHLVPDEEYCLQLLRSTGICTIPGSGFGQKDETYHYRIAILPSEEEILCVAEKLKSFHVSFLKKFE